MKFHTFSTFFQELRKFHFHLLACGEYVIPLAARVRFQLVHKGVLMVRMVMEDRHRPRARLSAQFDPFVPR